MKLLVFFKGTHHHNEKTSSRINVTSIEINQFTDQHSKSIQYKKCISETKHLPMGKIESKDIQKIFLEEMRSSNVHFEVSKALNNLSFSQCDPNDLKQIFACTSLKESLNNTLLAKLGDLLNKYWLDSGKSKESFLNILVFLSPTIYF